MREQVDIALIGLVENSTYFSLCLDESTFDQANVSQLLIFICVIQEDFSVKEYLLEILPLTGTTKGKNIYESVEKNINKIGGFNKCSAIVIEGAPAMEGEKFGQIKLLEKIME